MKSYLDLIPLSAKRHKRQGKMTLICIIPVSYTHLGAWFLARSLRPHV